MTNFAARKIACLLGALPLLSANTAHTQHDHAASTGSVQAEVVSPARFEAGKTASTVLRLTTVDGKPLTQDELQIAHTEKLHLLVVDDTLTDYHHEHPVAGENPGEYKFEFSPRVGGTYSIWADVVPAATAQQEYAKTQVKVEGAPAKPDKSLNTTADAGGYRFSLTTEQKEPLQAGKATMVNIKVTTPDGKDFLGLEPVMGAFAHMVAFPEDVASVTHVHPMGAEPKTAARARRTAVDLSCGTREGRVPEAIPSDADRREGSVRGLRAERATGIGRSYISLERVHLPDAPRSEAKGARQMPEVRDDSGSHKGRPKA